jgi:hypothetical protein
MKTTSDDWITIKELARRECLSMSTVRRAVAARVVTFRRRGFGKKAPLEFPARLAHAQLWKLRVSDGIKPPGQPDEVGLFSVLQAIRDLTARFERLEAAVLSNHSSRS